MSLVEKFGQIPDISTSRAKTSNFQVESDVNIGIDLSV